MQNYKGQFRHGIKTTSALLLYSNDSVEVKIWVRPIVSLLYCHMTGASISILFIYLNNKIPVCISVLPKYVFCIKED